jgi:hypothetical protein
MGVILEKTYLVRVGLRSNIREIMGVILEKTYYEGGGSLILPPYFL